MKLGDRVQVIFLKVRRKLVQRGDLGKIMYSTSEHNAATDVVDLFGKNGYIERGSAKALRERYPGLRTIQVVYALLLEGVKEPELVRITIKGALVHFRIVEIDEARKAKRGSNSAAKGAGVDAPSGNINPDDIPF